MSKSECFDADHGKFDVSVAFGQPAISAGSALPFIGVAVGVTGATGTTGTTGSTGTTLIGDYDLPIVFDTPVDPTKVIGGTIIAPNSFLGGTSSFTLGTNGIGLRFDINPCEKKNCIGHIVIPVAAVPLLVGLGVLTLTPAFTASSGTGSLTSLLASLDPALVSALLTARSAGPSLTANGAQARVTLWFASK
jgi:hypothetical protein